MRPYSPVRDCILHKGGLRIGVPEPLIRQKDRIFGMLPDPCSVAVEIGTQQGWFAYRILRNSKVSRLYCIDPWLPYRKHDGYGDHNFLCWKKNLSRWFPGDRVTPIRMKSVEAFERWSKMETEPIDFLFIDGSHYRDAVLSDLETWEPSVRSGGLVSGHDWSGHWANEVQPAVREYASRIGAEISNGEIYDYTGKGKSAECWWWYKK